MKIVKVNIDKLIFPGYNPRKKLTPEDSEYKKIKASIEKFGYVDLVIVNKDFTIIGGNQRVQILKDLGYTEIDVVQLELNKKEEKALNIALNKIQGTWDEEKLNTILEDLKLNFENDFFLTGFDSKEFEQLTNKFNEVKVKDDNFDGVVDRKNIKTKLGDIILLGNHVLMCGNSFDINQINQLINNNKIDMMFTDPPYDMQMGGLGCFKESTKNMKKRTNDIIEFDVNKLSHFVNLDIGTFYICTSKNGIKDYLKIFDEFNFNILVWCKSNPTPWSNNTFLPDIEYILYFADSKKRIWNNSLKPTDIYKKYYISKKEEGREGEGDLHPTMKPLDLISNRIQISSKENGIVLDLFGGSGSTLIACEQLNRKCYIMELDPAYCDVIINRYNKFKKDE